ncbi:helix-turn-helix domain-containing protein [Nocardiopsis sp. NPDC050513]|uniref:helix-turn-helix domain-containing protein n=1 Tax=Nocardiopsis sp. NPDC050513 TaxID=3364338 RepID=UPI0037BA00FB
MDEAIRIGPELKERREDAGLTQEALADRAGVSADYVGRLERGARVGSLPSIVKLARALDCDPGDLIRKRARLTPVGTSSVIAVRNAIFDPQLLLPDRPQGRPASPEELMRTVRRGYGAYFAGEFGALAALVPDLLRDCRIAEYEHGTDAVAAPYAHAYDLASALLVHTGKVDAALTGVERAITTARQGDDPYRPVSFTGTYAWVLLHMGRYAEAEDLVVRAAECVAPRMGDRDQARIAVWGGLLMQAAVLAGSDAHRSDADRLSSARQFLRDARSAAVQMDQDSRRYWISFGPTQLAVQSAHIYTVLRKPAEALKAAGKVDVRQLLSIQYGRHLLDVAKSQSLRRRTDDAIETAAQAQALSPEWFRHQKFGAALTEELRRRKARMSDPLAGLVSAFRTTSE